MNNQNHKSQNKTQFLSNPNNQYRSQGQNQIMMKRQQNRKQIRRGQIQQYFKYTILLMQSIGVGNLIIFNNITNQCNSEPFWKYSPQISKVLIYTNSTTSKPLYKGYYINYESLITIQIELPWTIVDYPYINFMTIDEDFFYVRNSRPHKGQFNHSAYTFIKQNLYPYFQENAIIQSQLNNNWITTFIQLPSNFINTKFLNRQLLIFHLHSTFNKYYFKRQIVDPFYTKEKTYYSAFVEMNFTIQGSNYTPIFISLNVLKWIYAIKDNQKTTTVYVPSYDYDKKTLLNVKIQLLNHELIDFYSFQFNAKIDCFYIQQKEISAINFYRVDNQSITYLAGIQSLQFPLKFPRTGNQTKKLHIVFSPNCQKIKVLNNLYFLNKGSTPLKYEIPSNLPFNVSNTIFDADLRFAVSGQNMFKFNGISYQKIITSNFKSINSLVVSEDQKVVWVRTYQQKNQTLTNPQTNKTQYQYYYNLQNKLFYYSNNSWIQIINKQSVTFNRKIRTFKQQPISISKKFQTLIVCYQIIIDKSQDQSQCLFMMNDFVNLKRYEQFHRFNEARYYLYRNIQSMYIYLMEGQKFTRNGISIPSECIQKIFEIKNYTLNLKTQFQIDCSLYIYDQDYSKRIIYEISQNKSFNYIWEYINGNKAFLINSTSKTVDIINKELQYKNLNKGYFYNNGSFYQCSPGCIICFSYHFCLKCTDGYYLNRTIYKCQKCGGDCKTCNAQNPNQCYPPCSNGYFLNLYNLICMKCNQNCLTCSGQSQKKCTSCRIGYFYNTNPLKSQRLTCLKCPNNCDSCSNTTFCTVCSYGYSALMNGSCIKCPLDCNLCSANQIIKCLKCRTGFQLTVIDEKSSCKKCPTYCSNCSLGICSQCRIGYILNKTVNICYQQCQTPCNNCLFDNSSACTSCLPGYVLRQNTCYPDLTCNLFWEDCKSCPIGYTSVSGYCTGCSLPNNCAQCHADDPTQCIMCFKGFYLFNSSCIPCLDNCLDCIDAYICKKCQKGYMFSWNSLTVSQCIQCSKNCKQCIESKTNCQVCFDGYKLIGSTCVSNFNVKFTLQLNLNFVNLTSDICDKIISHIATITGKDLSLIHITLLKSGSTIVEGSMDVKNFEDQSLSLAILGKALSSGSTIGGSQILTSNFVGFTPTIQNNSATQSVNLSLILGISIPGSIILLSIIVLIIYKKCYQQNKQIPQIQSDRSSQSNFTDKTQPDKEVTEPKRNKAIIPRTGISR